MDHYTVKRLALILAVQARIEGMKAENMKREIQGESMAYGDKDFGIAEMDLQNLAHAHDEDLR